MRQIKTAPPVRTPGWESASQFLHALHRGGQFFIDLVFPPRCAGCGCVDTVWCERCRQEVDHIPLPHPISVAEPLAALAASAPHSGKLRQAIHALKYENGRAIAPVLAQRLASVVAANAWSCDLLLAVPISTSRLRERGYNQSGLIAQSLAQEINVAYQPSFISRLRDTRSQVGLSALERRANVADAFYADPTGIAGRSILLIDDVYTTGATLVACATALRSAGAAAVYAITVTAAHLS